MSGSASTNNSAVQFEMQQAAQAQQKEADRQARLTQGQKAIDAIFNGQPVMGSKTSNYDWSTFKPDSNALTAAYGGGATQDTGAPAGYTAVQVPAKGGGSGGGQGAYTPGAMLNTGTTRAPGTWSAASGGGGSGSGGTTWALKDANGKIYYQGDPLSVTSQYDTGQRTGGFDDAFYNKYNQKILDYYNPQEKRQYDENLRNLRYNLANSGNLISSTAADQQGEQAYNDALAKAAIVANANSQTGQLKNQIQSNKESLISQLYATEDPTLTANLAESSAKASQLQDPTLTPGAAFLTPALSAVGSAAQGYLYPNPYGYGQQQPQQGTVAPASGTGSGRLSGS
jgi:hypothetical protein